ncbi:MAG: hypothetical protein UU47_C0001G0113 [candidate division TM6 bacterium GW2011_GWE2_41_16]|nr:MAG: hypothetical protein UU47_C0001G0113 [candidate division TM6 bacterium GW2011_GWE2_41_16]
MKLFTIFSFSLLILSCSVQAMNVWLGEPVAIRVINNNVNAHIASSEVALALNQLAGNIQAVVNELGVISALKRSRKYDRSKVDSFKKRMLLDGLQDPALNIEEKKLLRTMARKLVDLL